MSHHARLLCCLLLCLPLRLACAQVAVQGTAGSGNSGTGTVDTLTFSATVSAGSTLALVCGFVTSCVTACPTTATVTFNGDSLSFLGSQVQGTNNKCHLYGMVNPDVTTGNVSVDPDNNQRISGGCTTLTGVDQASPFGTAVDETGGGNVTSLNCTITIPTDGAGVGVGCGNDSANDLEMTGTNVTERWDQATTSGTTSNNRLSVGGTSTTAGSRTFTSTSSSAAQLTAVCVPVNAAAVAGSPRRPVHILLGR